MLGCVWCDTTKDHRFYKWPFHFRLTCSVRMHWVTCERSPVKINMYDMAGFESTAGILWMVCIVHQNRIRKFMPKMKTVLNLQRCKNLNGFFPTHNLCSVEWNNVMAQVQLELLHFCGPSQSVTPPALLMHQYRACLKYTKELTG